MTEVRLQAGWACCQADSGCTGSALPPWGRCLAHLAPPDLDQAIKRAKTEGLDARGVTITPSLLERIFSLLDRTDHGSPIVPNAQFDQATIRDAWFRGATFTRDARFDQATFTGAARFSGVTFTRAARFFGVKFKGDAWFDRTIFTGVTWFDWATFTRDARFDQATFTGAMGFYHASFTGAARFSEATFIEDAGFDAVSLSGRLSFLRVRAAKRLQLALRDGSIGELDLTEASFAGPAVLTASLGDASIRQPRLISLVQADTTNLTVAGLDLSNCRFLGAINLERLRIDGPLLLGEAPGWWRARRRVLWEEGELRSWPDWATLDRQDGPEVAPHRGERASRLQAVYRELRKGREDAKDEPGAADFYYGEMEMRRQAARGVERWLLTGYWAASGYGLRASRAVAAFLIVVAIFAGLLYRWGFQSTSPSRITGVNMNSGAVTYAAAPPRPDLAAAFAYSAESATVFFRGSSPEQLTEWGRAFQVCLRLLGPTLLGLAGLAVRGRVKR